jgi:hypothetical protein
MAEQEPRKRHRTWSGIIFPLAAEVRVFPILTALSYKFENDIELLSAVVLFFTTRLILFTHEFSIHTKSLI